LQVDFDIEVDWIGFELHPETRPGGISVGKLLGPERAASFATYLDNFALDFGVTIKQPSTVPSTRRALAITEYARDNGKLTEFRDAVMQAHWLHGLNIESDDDLGTLAQKVGLDPVAAVAAGDSQKYLQRVSESRDSAKSLKIISIPTFIIGDNRSVGCQSYENLKKKAEQALR
jgi:predicted DsbA family dithiol-disulfide isomerase